jgi:hypothetical protein
MKTMAYHSPDVIRRLMRPTTNQLQRLSNDVIGPATGRDQLAHHGKDAWLILAVCETTFTAIILMLGVMKMTSINVTARLHFTNIGAPLGFSLQTLYNTDALFIIAVVLILKLVWISSHTSTFGQEAENSPNER